MLRRRSSANWRPSAGPLLLFWIILTLVLSAQGARSDAPLVTTNPDSSRTITWTFISAANLSLDNVSLAGGQALLPWNDQRVQWTSSAEFAGNGHLDSNLTRGTSGLELRANSTNHVADGDFNGTSGWTFLNGTTGKVVARQESPADDAILGYNVLTAKWDNFDDLTNWTWSSPPNTYGGISLDTVNRVEGTASMNMTLAISTGATWVSAVHSGPTNWSAHDTLVLWINATDVVPPLSFNITATVGASFRTTPELPLVQGWHETLVNITPLGTPLERNALQDVRFRINGQNVPSWSTRRVSFRPTHPSTLPHPTALSTPPWPLRRQERGNTSRSTSRAPRATEVPTCSRSISASSSTTHRSRMRTCEWTTCRWSGRTATTGHISRTPSA